MQTKEDTLAKEQSGEVERRDRVREIQDAAYTFALKYMPPEAAVAAAADVAQRYLQSVRLTLPPESVR